jgi:hypothetical protein
MSTECSASRASHQPDDIAAVTTNSGTSCALVLACASTFLPLHGAFTTCAGQPSRSVCWKLLERGFRSPRMLLGTGSKADTAANLHLLHSSTPPSLLVCSGHTGITEFADHDVRNHRSRGHSASIRRSGAGACSTAPSQVRARRRESHKIAHQLDMGNCSAGWYPGVAGAAAQ